tara:strand:+ start:425208 stop:425342 length:135 start_codon:yes stop_codon:yes gene_type:complete
MSLWVVVPALFTGYKVRIIKPWLANTVLILCLTQAVIVAGSVVL